MLTTQQSQLHWNIDKRKISKFNFLYNISILPSSFVVSPHINYHRDPSFPLLSLLKNKKILDSALWGHLKQHIISHKLHCSLITVKTITRARWLTSTRYIELSPKYFDITNFAGIETTTWIFFWDKRIKKLSVLIVKPLVQQTHVRQNQTRENFRYHFFTDDFIYH